MISYEQLSQAAVSALLEVLQTGDAESKVEAAKLILRMLGRVE